MKNYFLVLTMLLSIQGTNAQSKIDEDVNTSVISLVILNEKGDVLIKKATIGWITIGAFYEQRQTINEVIDSISNRYGVSITKPNLKGVFTYTFDFNNAVSVRQVYVAQSTTTNLPTNKNVEFRWAPKDEAIAKFKSTIPSLGEMIGQIIEYPQVVWGGSFLIQRKNEKNTSTVTEDFYAISDPTTY